MINMVFLGPPGAGKGTQSEQITKDYNIVQVSTGDILRNAVKEGNELGKLAKNYMDEGKLVPDNVIIGIVEDRLKEDDCKNGFILDGFPRTIPQAEALDSMLENNLEIKLTNVLSLEVDENIIMERLTGRRSCRECGKGYHVSFDPPEKEGVCDVCKGTLVQRDDDKEETIKKRLKIYYEQTSQLKNYYDKKGILQLIDGSKSPDSVYNAIQQALK